MNILGYLYKFYKEGSVMELQKQAYCTQELDTNIKPLANHCLHFILVICKTEEIRLDIF